ncbi:TPA: hypothetical protein KOT48_003685 [Clostridioides difficile]|nr:hypothetical protein [Clostridioides difficile]
MIFLSESHKERYLELTKMDRTSNGDVERETFFYIISGVQDLYLEVKSIYDFEDNMLQNLDSIDNVRNYLSSSSVKLLNLALQLYNGQQEQTIIETFSWLDDDKFELALNSIKIRFGKISI